MIHFVVGSVTVEGMGVWQLGNESVTAEGMGV